MVTMQTPILKRNKVINGKGEEKVITIDRILIIQRSCVRVWCNCARTATGYSEALCDANRLCGIAFETKAQFA